MKNRNRKKPVKGVLVDCELVPITDPVEIAELERRIAEAEKVLDGRSYAKLPKPRKRTRKAS